MSRSNLPGFNSGGAWIVPERPGLKLWEAAFVLQMSEREVLNLLGEEALLEGSDDEVSIYIVADAFTDRLLAEEVTPLARSILEWVAIGSLEVRPGPVDELPPRSR